MSSLGYGQTWQNVTSSRVLGTTYYNTTGKPITVLISWNSTSGVATASVGGAVVFNSATGGAYISTTTFIVPVNQSYVVSGGNGVQTWTELR
jgi:hypothetical protein